MTIWTPSIDARLRSVLDRVLAVRVDGRRTLALCAVGNFAVFLLLLHNLFTNLGSFNLQGYDEGRHIANAMEMLHSGNWVVNTYMGLPDFFNLKPPASMWAIMLSVKALGVSPLAVRLPFALSTVVTSLLCTGFVWRWKGPVAALVTSTAFASSLYLIDFHSGRTADPDALFVLFVTISVLATITAVRRPWVLPLSTTAISMAFLTKSYHAALAAVFLVGVLVVTRRSNAIRARHVVVSLAGALPVIGWGVARYSYDGTAFFAEMLRRDVLDRSASTIEGHVGGPDYYLVNLQSTFGPWVLLIAVSIFVLAGRGSVSRLRSYTATEDGRILLSLFAWVAIVFLAFSLVTSKLAWYTIPAIPALCIVVGALLPTAVQRCGRVGGVALVVLFASGAWMGQLAIMDVRRTEQNQAAQMALSNISQLHLRPGANLYLDPGYGGWQQNMTALADMYADVTFSGAGPDTFAADTLSGDATILVQYGTPAYRTALTPTTRIVSSYLDWALIQQEPQRVGSPRTAPAAP